MRERLLDAAVQAFADYGYQRTRIADIVRIAGTAHGNFYRHFAGKNAILLAALEGLYETLRRSTAAQPGDARVPSEAVMIRRNIAFFHLYAEHRHLLRVAREAAASHAVEGEGSDFVDLWLGMRRIFTDRNARWIERLKAAGEIDAAVVPDVMAEALGSLTEQLAYVQVGLSRVRPRPERLDELGTTCGLIWHRTLFPGRQTV